MPNEQEKEFTESIRKRRIAGLKEKYLPKYTTEDLMGLVGPTAGMTRFLSHGTRIPQKVARIAATKEFVDRMGKWGPTAEAAAGEFAGRFPRIAAHTQGAFTDLAKVKGYTEKTMGVTGAGKRVGPQNLQTPVVYNKNIANDPGKLMETLYHEGTHVAQELGLASKGGLAPTYRAGENALKKLGRNNAEAYWYNPPEVSARRVSARKLGSGDKPYRMGKNLNKLVTELPPGSEERIELGRLRLNRR